MKKKPYISVIITYFNKRRFIKKTLDSIFFQSFKNYELIFVYDDSNYEDLKYIKPYLKAFKNTKIIINKKNLGVARSRNKALAKCKGNYIAFIDSDDTWKKTKLMKQLKFMKKKSSNFSFTSYNVIDEQNKFIKKRIVTMDPTYEKLQKKNIIGLSTVMINRIIIKDINFPNLKTQEDFALWLSLIKKDINCLISMIHYLRGENVMTHFHQITYKKLLMHSNYIIFTKIKIYYYLFIV